MKSTTTDNKMTYDSDESYEEPTSECRQLIYSVLRVILIIFTLIEASLYIVFVLIVLVVTASFAFLPFCVPLVVALYGLYGASYMHRKSLKYYALGTTVLLVLSLIFISTFLNPTVIRRTSVKFMQVYEWDATWGDQPVDVVQKLLHCCGYNSPNDWDQLRPKNMDNNTLPKSCCLKQTKPCMKDHTDVVKDGCMSIMESPFWLSLSGLFVDLLLTAFATILMRRCPREDSRDDRRSFALA